MAAAPRATRGTSFEAPSSAPTAPASASSSSAAGGDEHAPIAYDPTCDDGEVGVVSVLQEHDEIAEGHGLADEIDQLELAGVPPEAAACAAAYLQGNFECDNDIGDSDDEAFHTFLQIAQHDGQDDVASNVAPADQQNQDGQSSLTGSHPGNTREGWSIDCGKQQPT